MKRVLIAIHALSFDGAEKVAAMWGNYLSQNGYQVAFLVRYRRKEEQSLDKSIKVYSIADTNEHYQAVSAIRRLQIVRQNVKAFAPNLIISFLPKMQLLMMLATWGIKCKRFETVRNNPWVDTDVGRKRPLWHLCFRRCDRIILQTEEQAEYFPKRMKKKCVVIRNPILAETAVKQYPEGYPRKFIALGRVSQQKNYPLMVEAFAKATANVEDCTLEIYGVGSESYTAFVQKQIDTAGLRDKIILKGRTDCVQEKLLCHDAYFMSSDYEGMPNALAEAMSAGLVCLSTDCKTGPKDMIDHGKNGLLAKTGDVGSFTEGIETILKMDRERCSQMGRQARASILSMCSEENTLARLKLEIESEV